jgi:hypothetical protein
MYNSGVSRREMAKVCMMNNEPPRSQPSSSAKRVIRALTEEEQT